MCMMILCYLLCTLSIELKWSLKSRGCRTRININMHWINWVKNYKIIHSYVLYISHSVIFFFFWYFDRSKFDLYCLPLVSGDATWFCSFAVNEDLENQTCWQAQQCKCSVGWFHSNDNHFLIYQLWQNPYLSAWSWGCWTMMFIGGGTNSSY